MIDVMISLKDRKINYVTNGAGGSQGKSVDRRLFS